MNGFGRSPAVQVAVRAAGAAGAAAAETAEEVEELQQGGGRRASVRGVPL